MVGIAIVGCGGMARAHAGNLLKIKEARVLALVDPVPERTAAFKAEYFPKAACYKDLNALLKSPPKGLDGVILVTPHTQHHAQAKKALLAGFHVLVEKPMVTDSKQGYDLWRTVKKTGRKLAIAFQAPYSPEFAWIAEQRDSGKLGKMELVNAWLCQGWLGGTRGTWRQQPRLSGGGQMYDSGAHAFNSVMWLVGEPVVEVSCFYDNCGAPVDINGVAVMKFANGTIASMAIGGNCPAFSTDLNISTPKFRVLTNQYGGKLEVTGADRKPFTPKLRKARSPVAGSPQGNFIDAILGRAKLKSTVRHGVMLSVLMDALYESARTRRIVRVKPVPEKL